MEQLARRHLKSTVRVLWIAVAITSTAVEAHPALLSSAPDQGATLESAPKEMKLLFSEPIEAAFTTVKLTDPSGKDGPVIKAQAEKADAKAASFTLPVLQSGVYRAYWSALGRDGHRMKGVVSFSVR